MADGAYEYWRSLYYDNCGDNYDNYYNNRGDYCNNRNYNGPRCAEYLSCSAEYMQPYFATTTFCSINWTSLYYFVMNQLFGYTIPYNVIKRAIYNLAESYKCKSYSFRDVDFGQVENRFAYLYMYASCHSSLVDKLMSDYFANFVAPQALRKKNVKICSLGGGPGCDVLGLKEAIARKFCSMQIESIVVDKYSEWGMIFREASRLVDNRVNPSYFQVADLLLETDRKQCRETIANADIVCLVKFVSVVMYVDRQEFDNLIQFILDEMSPGSSLLFIDSGGGGAFEAVRDVVSKHRAFYLHYLRRVVSFSFHENPRLPQFTFRFPVLRRCQVCIAIWQKE